MVATEERGLKSVGLLSSHKFGDFQATLMKSVELDKLTLISKFETFDTNNCYKLLRKFIYLLKLLTCQ